MTQLSFDSIDRWNASSAPGAPAAGRARRVFLGYEAAPLARAAGWIAAERGADAGALVVALPGARAVRRLQEHLARLLPPDAAPPRVLTQGALTDALVRAEAPAAGRLLRTLAWERALRELPDALARRLWTPPAGALPAEAPRERLRLAETVRALFGELAPEGLDLGSVASGRARPEIDEEAARWEALAAAQQGYRALLARHGLEDPHDARRRAIDEGRLERELDVVLVGVADMNQLLARALEKVGARVTALVVAPEEEAEAFDALGRLRARAWLAREVPFERERWSVCEKPVDQADAACARIAAWDGRFAAHELRLGVADESVVPYLERRLADAGARARHAAGTPLARARPLRLLAAVARYLRHGGYAELAALARDVDLAGALSDPHGVPARLDRYHRAHLPASGRGPWLGAPGDAAAARAGDGGAPAAPSERERREARALDLLRGDLARVEDELARALGSLATDEPRPPAAWAAPLRALLARAYPRPLDPTNESEHALAEALRALGGALGELEQVPDDLAAEPLGAADAIELLLADLRRERVAPPAARPGERAVELLGWLDLPLDEAPALVVTGFNEGRVPQSVEGHPFLPDGLRRRLGLPAAEERLARDAYATTVLARSGRELAFVTGRRSAEGDPLVPSRLSFRAPADEVVARVRAFLGDEARPAAAARLGADDERDLACPRLEGQEAPTALSVSAFGTYLASPYAFFVRHVLRLETIDDRARELEPAGFGNLAHETLRRFAERGPRDADDPAEIHAFLAAELERGVAARYGAQPLAAVRLQARQLEHRLRAFAERQAEHRRAGWRILHAEWRPAGGGAALDVDGVPCGVRGQIDRVDVHEDGRWAILDYKTGERQKDPRRAHRDRGGAWTSLQLPLYRLLARELDRAGEPRLGFFAIGKSERDVGLRWADWTPAELDEALEVARGVVRAVRAGAFWERGSLPYEEILRAIWGAGTLGAGTEPVE